MGIKDWFGGDKKKAAYREKVKEAVSDGKLSQTAIHDLEALRKELDVDGADADKTHIRRELFNEAFDAKRSQGQLTQTGILDMAKIQKFLALRDDQVTDTRVEMNRLRMLTEIRKGNLPNVPGTHSALRGVKLEPGEVAYYTVQVQMSTSMAAPDDGLLIKPNFKYEEGASRAHFLPEQGAKPIGDGVVIITDQRLIIKTETGKVASVKYGEGQAALYNEGLRVKGSMGNSLLKFKSGADETAEIVGELLKAVTVREPSSGPR
jgi:hypothetical protein